MKKVVVLAAHATSSAAARRLVDEVLTGAPADVRTTVQLLTSELVTNVIHHTHSEVRVSVDAGSPVRVEVHDGHAATDAFREMFGAKRSVDPDATSGRGLSLVHDLASRVGLDDDPDGGKVVWFEIDI
ncbi:MAG TPA: ATP-binding protein [Acidimicrobiales bacterium]|nr:ATP-binding protein [Acidimicrobiales bacterium]